MINTIGTISTTQLDSELQKLQQASTHAIRNFMTLKRIISFTYATAVGQRLTFIFQVLAMCTSLFFLLLATYFYLNNYNYGCYSGYTSVYKYMPQVCPQAAAPPVDKITLVLCLMSAVAALGFCLPFFLALFKMGGYGSFDLQAHRARLQSNAARLIDVCRSRPMPTGAVEMDDSGNERQPSAGDAHRICEAANFVMVCQGYTTQEIYREDESYRVFSPAIRSNGLLYMYFEYCVFNGGPALALVGALSCLYSLVATRRFDKRAGYLTSKLGGKGDDVTILQQNLDMWEQTRAVPIWVWLKVCIHMCLSLVSFLFLPMAGYLLWHYVLGESLNSTIELKQLLNYDTEANISAYILSGLYIIYHFSGPPAVFGIIILLILHLGTIGVYHSVWVLSLPLCSEIIFCIMLYLTNLDIEKILVINSFLAMSEFFPRMVPLQMLLFLGGYEKTVFGQMITWPVAMLDAIKRQELIAKSADLSVFKDED